ncbi:MAG: hypothetical protein Q9172_001568 [Xanthocarpia lactea]
MKSENDISEVLLPQNPQDERHNSTISPPSQESRATSAEDASQQPVLGHKGPDVDEASLALAFDQLNFYEEPLMAERMFLSLGVIIQKAVEGYDLDIDNQRIQDALSRADQSSRHGGREIEVLETIQTILDRLLLLGSDHFVEAATILANASRDESWRLPFGQSGLLALFLRIQATEGVEDRILIPCLRFIGNTCADTERAQHAFRMSGLCPALIELLQNPQFRAPDLLTYVYSLLDISSHQYDLAACPDNSIQTVVELLQVDDVEMDDLLLIVNTTSAFLHLDRFQQHFIENDLVDTLLEVIDRSSPAYQMNVAQASLPAVGRDPDEDTLSSVRSAVTQILSDLSATDAFAARYSIGSSLVDSLTRRLVSQQQQARICSCLMLGNLAQSDPVCLAMVSRLGLHDILLELLEDQSHPQVSYAALRFLRNLALPAENKPIIGTQRAVEIISRFWSVDVNPQIQHASVCLLKQLLNKSIGNVRWLLESLSPDPDSPAHEKTYLSLLLLLFGRTDDAATKFEIGRTVVTICRCISSASQGLPPESTTAIWHRLYGMHPNIAAPLAMMISQSRFPVLRSEGWFALALMARSREGSAAVSEVFQQLEIFSVLVSTITGQLATSNERSPTGSTGGSDSSSSGIDSSPQQLQEMKVKDRENALVLVNELLRHTGDNLSDIRRSVLEDLLRGPQSPEHAQELMTRSQSEERLV